MTIRYFTLVVLTCTLTACVNLKPKADTTRTYLLGPVDVSSKGESSLHDIYIARPNLPAYLEGNHMQYRNEQGELKIEMAGTEYTEWPLQRQSALVHRVERAYNDWESANANSHGVSEAIVNFLVIKYVLQKVFTYDWSKMFKPFSSNRASYN